MVLLFFDNAPLFENEESDRFVLLALGQTEELKFCSFYELHVPNEGSYFFVRWDWLDPLCVTCILRVPSAETE
jgi:hypothetical protein